MIRGNGRDDPLSAQGWRQVRQTVGSLEGWDQILSSPMARCRAFAAALSSERGLPLVVEPELREIGMGAWEGRRHQEIADCEPERYQRFREHPLTQRPPGGESPLALRARVAAIYDRLVVTYPGRRLLIVCHAGVCRALLSHVMDADLATCLHLRIGYGQLIRIEYGSQGPAVLSPLALSPLVSHTQASGGG